MEKYMNSLPLSIKYLNPTDYLAGNVDDFTRISYSQAL